MFGWKGPGWGWRRWLAAQSVGDPERAYFGLGPCGEYAYRLYKEGKVERPSEWIPGSGENLLLREIQELKKKIEELEKRLG